MSDFDIRQSLHYSTYVEHAKSLKLAADENLKLFLSLIEKPQNDEIRTKCVGLYNSTMLLYAVCVEILLKGRGLYIEKEDIKNGTIENYGQFMKRWGGHKDGHNFFKIIEHYKIGIPEKHQKILMELKSFTNWAGRFPFPKSENDTLMFENGKGKRGSLNKKYKDEINFFFLEQIKQMQY